MKPAKASHIAMSEYTSDELRNSCGDDAGKDSSVTRNAASPLSCLVNETLQLWCGLVTRPRDDTPLPLQCVSQPEGVYKVTVSVIANTCQIFFNGNILRC